MAQKLASSRTSPILSVLARRSIHTGNTFGMVAGTHVRREEIALGTVDGA
nr:hypothetical protein [Zoogloeaceae bacterium]